MNPLINFYLANKANILPAQQGPRSRGGEGFTPQYFQNYKDLVRKSVLCPPPPQYWVTNGAPPQSQSCSAVPAEQKWKTGFPEIVSFFAEHAQADKQI